ncbi:hypothetical protein FPV67DRAFT_1648912 [Lyophyllum atratum]|nr:hypothetical protein FPV67DRAFT_1648912 [Lyophyllum atratum]
MVHYGNTIMLCKNAADAAFSRDFGSKVEIGTMRRTWSTMNTIMLCKNAADAAFSRDLGSKVEIGTMRTTWSTMGIRLCHSKTPPTLRSAAIWAQKPK